MTKQERDALRELVVEAERADEVFESVSVSGKDFRFLLDAADEADRLRDELGQDEVINALTVERDRLRRCLGFFASVIKSGESWTETCQREYDLARGPTGGGDGGGA